MNRQNISQYEKMTATPVPRLIISLSIPTIISMLVTNIYNLVDTAFVGTLGNSASGAIGIVFGFMSILQAIGFLFGQGSGSILSRKLGQQKKDEASSIASTGIFFAFTMAVITMAVCAIFLDSIIRLLGSTETIAPYAKTYITFILITAPFQVTTFTLNNILRYEGKALYGMIGLMSGAIINIGGDALFMFGLDMGITGAGLSTAISQFISFAILMVPFLRGKTQCKLSFRHILFEPKQIGNILATGSPSLVRQGLSSMATIMLNFVCKPYGDEAIAGMSITSRVFFFILAIGIGVGQGFQPVSGFNYGAKKYRRLRKAHSFTIFFSELVMLVLGTVVFITAPELVRLFRDDPTVTAIAVRSLRYQCVCALFLPIGMITEMMFQSTGFKVQAIVLSAARSGIIFIPLLLILSKLQGLAGIQVAQAYAFVLSVIPALILKYRFMKKLPQEDL